MKKKELFFIVLLACVYTTILVVPLSFLRENKEGRVAAASVEMVTFQPKEIDSVLNNPYIGWVPKATGSLTATQTFRMVHAYITWRELEPIKGQYAFDTFETKNQFSAWGSKDVKIIIRVVLDYPSGTSHRDIPDWLYNEISGDGMAYDISYGKGFSPNYNNSTLINYHRQLITKLGERYDNDSRVVFIQLGSVGHWGEWHTLNDKSVSIPFPKIEIANQYVQPYIDSFKNKILMVRRPIQIAKDNGFGLYNDCFGNFNQTQKWFVDWINGGYTSGMTGETMPSMPDYWKTRPSGGEFCNYPGTMYVQDNTIQETIRQAQISHTSWLGPCSMATVSDAALQNNINALRKVMGYRFVLQSVSHGKEVSPGGKLGLSMTWNNKGVAPFYFKWPVELSLINSTGTVAQKYTLTEDIRTWLPGTKSISYQLAISSALTEGTYNLAVAIINPEKSQPGIDLAIDGRRSDGRYLLDQFQVIKSVSTTLTPTTIPTLIPTIKLTSTPIPTIKPTATSTIKPAATYTITLYGCNSMNLYKNESNCQFSALVRDTSASTVSKNNVIYSIDGNPAGLRITSSGLLYLDPLLVKVSAFTLRATLVGNASVTTTKQVSIIIPTPTVIPTVKPTPTPISTGTTVAVDTGYKAEAWNYSRGWFIGIPSYRSPVVTTQVSAINFNWGEGSPTAKINKDKFIARFTGTKSFEAGKYQFTTTSDDGVRLWVDDQLIINQWTRHSAQMDTASLDLTAGTHKIRLEYFEYQGNALIRMGIKKI